MSFFSGVFQSLCASFLYESIGNENMSEEKGIIKFMYNFIPIFQLFWVVELYYFAINYIIKIDIMKHIISNVINNNEIISLLIHKNSIILSCFHKWQGFLIMISMLIFISAIFIEIIIRSFFEGNMRLILFSQNIIYFGKIILFTWLTYKLFIWNSICYVFIIILAIIYTYKNEIKKLINSKCSI
jgi:hypothetical protein